MKQYDSSKTLKPIVEMAAKLFSTQLRIQMEVTPKIDIATKIANDFVKSLQARMPKYIKKFTIGMERIREFIVETEDDLAAFRIMSAKLGYPPNFNMDIPTIRSIVASYQDDKELTSDIFDDFMCTYYDSEMINRIELGWEKRDFLHKRISILRNVIMAHNLGMYGVSVPAIIAQYEGILADAYNLKCKVDGRITNIMINNLLNNSSGWIKDYDKAALNYYNDNLLDDFYHGKTISSVISRHAILHGGDFKYDKEDVSLRAILLFDYISDRIKDISEADIKIVNAQVNSYVRWKRNKNKK